MSVRQDQFTFFGVLIAVVIVVIGYLQLSRLYPVTGRGDHTVQEPHGDETKGPGEAPREGGAQP
jgi:Tfp pilus assembly protein PilV